MAKYPYRGSDFDEAGGTAIERYIGMYYDTDPFIKMLNLKKVGLKRRIQLISEILDGKDLQSYRDNLLLNALEYFDGFTQELKEYPPYDQQVECIRWHIRLIDHVDSFHLSHLYKIFESYTVDNNEVFHPYEYVQKDLSDHCKVAIILKELIQTQKDVIFELKQAFFLLAKNPLYRHYEIPVFSTGGTLIWDESKQPGMRKYFQSLYKDKKLYTPLGNDFNTIYSIISSKIHRSSLKTVDFELSFKHIRDKVEWMGLRPEFILSFKKLIEAGNLTIDKESSIESIVSELYKVFLLRNAKTNEEISLSTLITNFKGNLPKEFLKSEKKRPIPKSN